MIAGLKSTGIPKRSQSEDEDNSTDEYPSYKRPLSKCSMHITLVTVNSYLDEVKYESFHISIWMV